jgi:hypothetical protein
MQTAGNYCCGSTEIIERNAADQSRCRGGRWPTPPIGFSIRFSAAEHRPMRRLTILGERPV